jgi:hypothetical protein
MSSDSIPFNNVLTVRAQCYEDQEYIATELLPDKLNCEVKAAIPTSTVPVFLQSTTYK